MRKLGTIGLRGTKSPKNVNLVKMTLGFPDVYSVYKAI